jgi:hypothetical protein
MISESTVLYAQRPVGKSILLLSPYLGPKARCLLLSDGFGFFVVVGPPLWWEDGSVVYSCCWSSSAQSFSGLIILYSFRFETPPVLVCISPKKRVAQFYPQTLNFVFVAFYESQKYGGGVRTRLHAGWLLTGSCYNISAMLSRCRGNVSTESFRSNGHCTAASLHSCYLAVRLHVRVLFGRICQFMRTYLAFPVVYFLQHVSFPRFDYRHEGTVTKDS